MPVHLNRKGSALVGVTIGAGLIGIVSLGIATLIGDIWKAQNSSKTLSEANNFQDELRSHLSNQQACLNTFGGARDYRVPHPKTFDIGDIKNGEAPPAGATIKYAKNVALGSGSFEIAAMKIEYPSPLNSPIDLGEALFSISYKPRGQVLGPAVLKAREIILGVKIAADGTMTECIPKSKLTDGIWRRLASDNSKIYYNEGSVGVGTTTPSTALEVVSETTGGVGRAVSSTLYNTATPWGGVFVARHARGTASSPGAVQTDDLLGSFVTQGHNGSSFAPPSFGTGMVGIATQPWTSGAHGSKLAFYTTDNGQLNATSKMTIDQNGNVGIGTNTPNRPLVVRKNLASDLWASVENPNPLGTSGFLMVNDVNAIADVWLQGSGVGASYGGPNSLNIWNAAAGPITIGNREAGVEKERMRILNNGNVGINTTTPAAKLDVQGDVKLGNSNVACTSSNLGSIRYNSSTDSIEFCKNNGGAHGWASAGGGAGSCRICLSMYNSDSHVWTAEQCSAYSSGNVKQTAQANSPVHANSLGIRVSIQCL